MDRFTHFALAATAQALEQAALEITDTNRDDIGVLIGSGIGGLQTLNDQILCWNTRGRGGSTRSLSRWSSLTWRRGRSPYSSGYRGRTSPWSRPARPAPTRLARGPRSSAGAMRKAMVFGGTEAPITEIGIATFGAMRALSTHNEEPQKASRPFDAERDGFVMGEGGAVLILEDYDWARARGARILGEVVGYGLTADASHVTAPVEGGVGAARAMTNALRRAGLTPAQIGYINAHGTGTQLNEKFETMAIKKALGDVAYDIPVSSTKSMTGHLLGAAGALEAIFCLKALETGCLPPTINLEHPDPDCDLDNIPNVARSKKIDYAMTNSMGFGGHNVSLILAGAHTVE